MTALITGATTGIGRALALLLASEGYDLILMARREPLLQELKAQLTAQCPARTVVIVVSDVGDHEGHMEAVRHHAQQFKTLDLVIANAGIGFTTHEAKNTWTHSLQTMNTNVLGAIATIEAAKDILLLQGFGHIVGITSVAAIRGLPQSSAYCASKAALATFLESLRIDLASHHIPVTAIHPGFVETPMTEKNGHMPWLMTAERAAQKIYRAIQRKKARYFFPWQMMVLAKFSSLTPDSLYDLIMKISQKRVAEFKKDRG